MSSTFSFEEMVLLLIDDEITVKWNPMNVRHYESLGYKLTHFRDELKIRASQLPKNSCIKIRVKCDYCGKVFEKVNEMRNAHFEVTGKDACRKCAYKKIKESNLITYGVDNVQRIKKIHDKTANQVRHKIEFIKEEFSKCGYELVSKEYVNAISKLQYICPKHGLKEISYSSLHYGERCAECRHESATGEGCYNWKGGITNISAFLRNKIFPWVADTIKEQHGKCIISGADSDVVHHIHGFSLIRDETFSSTGIDVRKSVSDYSEYELKLLSEKCLQLHYKYGLGACLTEALHKEFHEEYGYGDNTKAQFEEFCKEHSS